MSEANQGFSVESPQFRITAGNPATPTTENPLRKHGIFSYKVIYNTGIFLIFRPSLTPLS
jgi:hypothetical protein